jgi:hypothetical protein
MVQRGEKPSFSLEASELLRMLLELFGKDFDGHFTPELCVPGAVDLTHTPGPQRREDLIGSELLAGRERHCLFAP